MQDELSSVRLTGEKEHDTIGPLTSRLGRSYPQYAFLLPRSFPEGQGERTTDDARIFRAAETLREGVTLTGLKG